MQTLDRVTFALFLATPSEETEACARIARGMLELAGRPPFCDPRELAVSLGYEVAASIFGSDPDPDRPPTRLVYEWHEDERMRGLSVFLEMGKAALRRLAPRSLSLRNAGLIAALLAVPDSVVAAHTIGALVKLQRHVPTWMIEGRAAARSFSGFRHVSKTR